MHIVFFQHGDFGEAYRRFLGGEAETYRDQKKSVDFVASFRDQHVISTVAVCARAHHEELAENLHSIGTTRQTAAAPGAIEALMQSLRPDMIVCRSPNLNVLRWARRHHVPTLPIFADIFANKPLRKLGHHLVLRQTLLAPIFPCVANHSLNASLSVRRALFFPETRIVPWDRASLDIEAQPKARRGDTGPLRIFYAGNLTEAKGVGDCLKALRTLKDRGRHVQIEFAGPGEQPIWQKEAADLQITDRVAFLGRIANTMVRQKMRACDIVVVPSRHNYPEGLPNTLCEGLASRTPVIISDHPAFAGRLEDRQDCLIFPASDAVALADRIAELDDDAALYADLSQNGGHAYASLYFGIEWTRLVKTFIADPSNATGWVEQNSLRRLLRDRAVKKASRNVGSVTSN
jgi:glycosyltransferase involved in cell wall biosynthesis